MEKKQNVTLVTAKDSVVDVILKYRACDEWENLLKYVMEPNRVRPLMQSYYAKNGVSSKELDFNTVKNALVKLKENLFVTKGSGVHGFYVVKTNEGYKVDWEATVEYNPVELLELENMSGKTIEWRGSIMMFSSNNEWYHNYYGTTNLYAKKGTKADNDMFEIMKDKNTHHIIVKVKRTTDGAGNPMNEIVEVVSKNSSKY